MKKQALLPADIERKIKQLEIYTRRLLNSSLVGDTRSAIKGSGFEFDQIRDYQAGDDVRFIDWKASARTNKMLIKQYVEERSRTVILVVDVSGSQFFGSGSDLKRDTLAQIAGVLALVAAYGKDLVGLLLFSDHVEKYIPPKQGIVHTRIIMEALFSHESKSKKTDLSAPLQHLVQIAKKNSIVFFLSDFLNSFDSPYLPAASRIYDMIAVRCVDPIETTVPSVGLLPIEDIETGQMYYIDTRSANAKEINAMLSLMHEKYKTLLKKYGISLLEVSPHRPYIHDVVQFLRYRMQY
jgi:uncharacterized protein (DUF58 family)